jgi:sugar phosphate isomerase/epimerase
VIAQHQLWQCRHVAIGSMPGEFRQEGEAGFKRFAEIANGIGEKLHAAGLSFSYHNHSFEFMKFGGRTGLDILYSETDPQFVQAEIDTFWIQHGGGDPVHWIRAMKNRMPVIHLKDMVMIEDQDSHARMGVRQMEAEIGQGNLNWPPILKACREAGVEWYAIEQDFSLRDPFESLALSYRYLNELGYA